MPHVTVSGHALYYEWRGGAPADAPVVVFLHDGLGAVGGWKDVPEHVAAALGARALLLDRWGYGRSDPRPDFPFRFMEAEVEPLRETLAALGVGPAFLVGHSDGGSIALLYAARYPEAVRAAVTEAAHVIFERETQAGIEALVALQRQGRTPGWLKRLHGERAEALLAAWSAGWLSAEHARWDITPHLPGVRCPLLAVQGERDEFGTARQVELIRRGVPHAESWLVPGSGHTPHAFVQAEFERRVADFLARHGASQQD
jgi:pimeloyl-ACP methyl ester carboxylesterase